MNFLYFIYFHLVIITVDESRKFPDHCEHYHMKLDRRQKLRWRKKFNRRQNYKCKFLSPMDFFYSIDFHILVLTVDEKYIFVFTQSTTMWWSVRSRKFNPRQKIESEIETEIWTFCFTLNFSYSIDFHVIALIVDETSCFLVHRKYYSMVGYP